MLFELGRGLHQATVEWRMPSGTPVVTIVLKATFRLRPDVVDLIEEGGEPVCQNDETSPRGSLSVQRAGELVPGKAQPEMLLVGSAFAPDELPVQSLVARMTVGQVSKAIEVFGERWWQPDETLGQPTPWLSFPLTYEHAAGGPATWNPIGVTVATSGDITRRRAPSLVLPGASPRSPSALTPVACFAPIPQAWAIRKERADALRRIAIAQSLETESELMVHQAAPTDQLLDALDGDELVVLENLCRGSARLAFRLPGIAPRVYVPGALGAGAIQATGGGVLAKADTIVIDTDKEILTLVWRSRHRLSDEERNGTFVIEWARVSEDPALAMAQEAIFAHEDGQTIVTKNHPWLRDDTTIPVDRTKRTQPEMVLPPGFAASQPSPRAPPPPSLASAPSTPLHSAVPRPQSAQLQPLPTPESAHRPLHRPTSVQGSPPRPLAPAPSSRQRMSDEVVARGVPRPAGPKIVSSSADAQSKGSPPASTNQSPRSGVRAAPDPKLLGFAWCDAKRIGDVQQHPPYRSILDAWIREPAISPSLSASPEDELRSDAERAFSRILQNTVVTPLEGLAEAGFALMDGASAPLVVLEGELWFTFEPSLELAWTARLAAPMAARDPVLQRLVTEAHDLEGMPLGANASLAHDLAARIAEAWSAHHPEYPAELFQSNLREKLLAERAFSWRRVFGENHWRALLRGTSGGALRLYLPEPAVFSLPLVQSAPVRILAEVRPPQEEMGRAEIALRAIAIAIVVSVPR